MQISYHKFPNAMFLQSTDVLMLMYKLYIYCDSSTMTYGLKRPLLDIYYPELCPLFDLARENMTEAGPNAELGTLKFYESLGLDDASLISLKKQLMLYASENLIKINAFLDSPYLSKFETDEVLNVQYLYAFFFVSGDVDHDVHRQHRRNARPLHGLLFCQSCRDLLLFISNADQQDTKQEMNKI